MKFQQFFGTVLVCTALLVILSPLASAATLAKADFEEESFAKTVDYYDYVRAYATLHGVSIPAGFEKWHANVYMTYVNKSGLKLLYAGLENVTTDDSAYARIPMQSFIMHYKTNEQNRDVILASTFLMLMAFNETNTSRFSNSPDLNDTLYASFSLGFDLSKLGETLPVLNSDTKIIPLTSSDDKLEWTWGMRYTNLTALWWRTWIDPTRPGFNNSWPLALTVYDELSFTYNLKIDPVSGTATLQENHIIGRMRHLFVGLIPFLWVYYNSTGNFGMLGNNLGHETIYDYIRDNQLKMSIINFQTSIMADHDTYSKTSTGKNVEQTETTISDSSVTTFADDGEKIFDTDFGSKQTYRLFNYVDDPTETVFEEFNSVTRTAEIQGFAGNVGLFVYHIGLMKFLPLVVVHMYPALFQKAFSTISNMSKANYFYIVAYPEYSGFRIEHDPTFTAYIAAEPNDSANQGSLFFILIVVVIAIVVVSLFVGTRKPKITATEK